MYLLNENADLVRFWNHVGRADQRILFLDYDGTLAPYQINPAKAVPYPGVLEILQRMLERKRSRIIIVTGRSVSDLEPLLALPALPEVWGEHGSEHRLQNGERAVLELTPLHHIGFAKARDALALHFPEARLEVKHTSLAAHWRGVPMDSIASRSPAVACCWADIARGHGLELLPFEQGIEIRPMGATKGLSVRLSLGEVSGTAAVAYLGDDQTDEDGFYAVRQWVQADPASRVGLTALVRVDTPRPTKADVWIKPPEEILSFLELWDSTTHGDPCSLRPTETPFNPSRRERS